MFPWPILTAVLTACDPPEPVISGIPAQPLLSPDDETPKQETKTVARYTKPKDVYVDVRHLCGQRFEVIRDQLYDQLGARQNTRDLGEVYGKEIQYTRGSIRMIDGIVYMMSIPLLEPMYRRQALQTIGFPAQTSNVLSYSGEFRINNQWEFRRLRLKRSARDAETVKEVDVWKWLPRERQ